MMEMNNIRSAVNRLRFRIRGLTFCQGMGQLVIVACFLSVATFVCDYLFRLPAEVRLTLLGISFVMVAATVIRSLVLPLRVPISDDDAALCIESAYPEIDCRLISSIQIGRTLGDKRYVFSRSLAQRLIADTEKMAADVDVSRVTRAAPVVKHCLWAGLFLAVLGVACAAEPVIFSRWLNRIMGGSANYPRSTELHIVCPSKVVRGDDVVVKITPEKGDPSRVRLHFRFEGGDKGWVSAERTSQSGNDYVYTFKQVMEPFEFMVSGGDFDSDYRPVQIRIPPRIEEVEIRMVSPAYTRMPPASQNNGNIRALPGTEVTFTAGANIDLADARISFRTGSVERTSGLAIEGDKKTVSGVFTVENNADYEISLTSLDGLTNREPVKYRIDVVPDRLPLVAITRPAADMEAPSNATIPLTIEASDDFGVREISLIYRVKPKGEGEDQVANAEDRTVPIPFDGMKEQFGRKNVKTAFPFDLAAVKVKDPSGKERPLDEGDTLSYFVQVADHNKGIGQSGKYIFTIISIVEIMSRIEGAQRDILHELESILAVQERTLTDTQEIAKTAKQQAPGAQEAKQIVEKERSQGEVGNRCRDVTARLGKLIDQIEFFKLEQIKITGKLQIVFNAVSKIATEKSPLAQQLLTTAARINENTVKSLDGSAKVQKEIVQDLNVAITLMREWSDISSIIRAFEEMRRKQDQVKENLPGAGNGVKPPEEKKIDEPKKETVDPKIQKEQEAKKALLELKDGLNGVKTDAADCAQRLSALLEKSDAVAKLLASLDAPRSDAFKPARQAVLEALNAAKGPKTAKTPGLIATKIKDAVKTIDTVVAMFAK